eukprot:COSAG02_NODE_34911_length_476_cov_1.278515_1_plen_26_part_10
MGDQSWAQTSEDDFTNEVRYEKGRDA